MDNNDSNIKSQQTGGLKLMTVFIAVLALHVVVIGGFTVYHLMSGGSTDSDLATTTDKTHKSVDSSTTDTTTADKSTTTAAPTEVATIPATTVTPASAPAPTGDTVTASVASNPAPASAITPATATPTATTTASTTVTPTSAPTPIATPALTLAQPTAAPAPIAATVVNPGAQTPTGPIPPDLAPPAELTAIAPAPAPMAPVVAPTAGPVHMPPANKDASRVTHTATHEHEQVYTVKITDSYKKIAKAHHVTVAQLKEANGIKGDTLHSGQKLFIPSGKSEVAQSNSATASLASEPAVTHPSVAPMTTGLSSTTTSATTSEHHLYTIKKGDTLTKIAHEFKTTPHAIMEANSNLDPTKLTIGHKLHIPSKESRSAQVTAPIAQPVAPVAQPAQVQQAKSAPSAPASGELTSFSL